MFMVYLNKYNVNTHEKHGKYCNLIYLPIVTEYHREYCFPLKNRRK